MTGRVWNAFAPWSGSTPRSVRFQKDDSRAARSDEHVDGRSRQYVEVGSAARSFDASGPRRSACTRAEGGGAAGLALRAPGAADGGRRPADPTRARRAVRTGD